MLTKESIHQDDKTVMNLYIHLRKKSPLQK